MVKYRIVYIGDDRYLAWDADNKRFVPAEMHLYITKWDTPDEPIRIVNHEMIHTHSGWWEDIHIEPILANG